MRLIAQFSSSVVVLALATSFVGAQPKDAEGFAIQYFGVSACKDCHNRETPLPADETFTSRKIEAGIWLKYDKHKDATKSLQNARSKRIAELLNWKQDLTTEQRCVNCHGGVYIDPNNTNKDLVDASYRSLDQRVESGVSCVACHGPRIKWINDHMRTLGEPRWHDYSLATKVNEYGMYDLFDPVVRAKMCFSCHIGDVEKGRVVTHEMYAAGHPPLPGIEIATFSAAMPAHWEPMSKKIERARKLEAEKKGEVPNGFAFLKNAYDIDPTQETMEQTRMVAITSLVAIQSSVKLMAKQAEASLKDPMNPHVERWPALANYDCYACHHDLKPKSWRQERGYRGRPGRIEPRPWSLSLGRFSFDLAAGKSDPLAFDKALEPWYDIFQKTPFGTPEAAIQQSKVVDDLLAAKIEQLRKVRRDRAEGQKAARLLVDLARREIYDFDSARQFAWAIETVIREVDPKAERVSPVFRALDTELQLKLPAGRVEIVPNMLDAFYTKMSAYQPDRFREKMQELHKLLADPGR